MDRLSLNGDAKHIAMTLSARPGHACRAPAADRQHGRSPAQTRQCENCAGRGHRWVVSGAAHGEPARMRAAAHHAMIQTPITASVSSVHLLKGTDAPDAWHSVTELPLGAR
jgi:hypothetical protein